MGNQYTSQSIIEPINQPTHHHSTTSNWKMKFSSLVYNGPFVHVLVKKKKKMDSQNKGTMVEQVCVCVCLLQKRPNLSQKKCFFQFLVEYCCCCCCCTMNISHPCANIWFSLVCKHLLGQCTTVRSFCNNIVNHTRQTNCTTTAL
jgi:hypothetical protein